MFELYHTGHIYPNLKLAKNMSLHIPSINQKSHPGNLIPSGVDVCCRTYSINLLNPGLQDNTGVRLLKSLSVCTNAFMIYHTHGFRQNTQTMKTSS